MIKGQNDQEQIKDLDTALARIEELEKKLDEAIDVVVKRDDELDRMQRRILNLEDQLKLKS